MTRFLFSAELLRISVSTDTMKKLFSSKLEKRAALTAFIMCFLPQLIRIILNCIYSYEIEGNLAYSASVDALFVYGADVLGKLSFFASFGISAYLAFAGGMKRGKEWFLALTAAYVFAYILLTYVDNYLFGILTYLLCTILTITAFFVWMKIGKAVLTIICVSLFMSVIGGILTVFASGVPSDVELLFYSLYGMANYGFELLLVLLASILCDIFYASSKQKGRDELYISGVLFSLRRPVLASILISDIIFVLINSVSPTMNIISSIIEYGPPVNTAEWLSIFYVYLELILVFVFGYAVMRLSAGIVERADN